MTEKERNLLYGVVSLILPENILDQFDIVKLEDEDIARNDGTYQPFKHNVHIYLDEQDNRTAEQRATLKPNGFTEYTSVKDYPVHNRPVTSRSVGRIHGIDGDYLGQVYTDDLSGYEHWEQKAHGKDWILIAKKKAVSTRFLGRHLSIDESMYCGSLYTFVSTNDAHGGRGTIIAIIAGVKAATVLSWLLEIPDEERRGVLDVSMDFSDSMKLIAQTAFPNARISLDRSSDAPSTPSGLAPTNGATSSGSG